MPQLFQRDERVRRQRDFDRAFKEGRAFHFAEWTLRAVPNGLSHARLGLSVGRRVGGAVRRNRIKRLLREAWRLNKERMDIACDVVIVPRPAWKDLRLEVAEATMRRAMDDVRKAFRAQ